MQVHDFVSRYMPAYEAYLPQLYRDGPDRRSGAVNAIKVPYAGNQCGYFVFDFNGLTQIRVDSKRNPVEARMYV